jgi:hypothetical protein
MKKYERVFIAEHELEDLVRSNSNLIEDGLMYIDHQRPTSGGRLDVLFVSEDKSLAIAELKVSEDDGMLMQAVDYYDYVSNHVESYARLYHDFSIDPLKPIRLILIAPYFSQTLVNRCKWLDIKISLFTFICLRFEEDDSIVPVFTEQFIPETIKVIDIPKINDHLNWIEDPAIRKTVLSLFEEIKTWAPDQITIDPVKTGISMKIRGKVFAYLYPRHSFFVISTYNNEDVWSHTPVHVEEDLENAKKMMRETLERFRIRKEYG